MSQSLVYFYSQIKAVCYWPPYGDSDERRLQVYKGTIIVKTVGEHKEKDYVIREFDVRKEHDDGKVLITKL